jgi:undecaprenyl phosphate N,N'-diacetylbacillosamine 1-phosphate transferase
MKLYRKYLKRLFDFILSLLALCVLMPFFLLTSIFLFFSNKGNPFFFQRRPGRNERIFLLVKFKTMNDLRDSNGELLPDEERITRIGKFIRKISLDEIPQLFNVLKGDMSLIGPRPLLVEYLPLYNSRQKRRHEARPGITGWAQVNGRNAISWEQKFEYDVWYVENINFLLDMKIIALTIKKTFTSEGISQKGHATMPVFKGAENQ